MKVISKPVTRGVTALPLKRNIVSGFMKEIAQEMIKEALTAYQEGQRDS
jgi:hypothetical protein